MPTRSCLRIIGEIRRLHNYCDRPTRPVRMHVLAPPGPRETTAILALVHLCGGRGTRFIGISRSLERDSLEPDSSTSGSFGAATPSGGGLGTL